MRLLQLITRGMKFIHWCIVQTLATTRACREGLQRNETATSNHNDKMVNKKIGDEADNYEINLY